MAGHRSIKTDVTEPGDFDQDPNTDSLVAGLWVLLEGPIGETVVVGVSGHLGISELWQ